jgi:hypothetical protein
MFQKVPDIAAEIRLYRMRIRRLEAAGENGSVTCEETRGWLEDAEYRLVGRCSRDVLNDGGYDLYFETMLSYAGTER